MTPALEQQRRVRDIQDSIRQSPDYAVESAKLALTEQLLERLERLNLTRAELARRAGVSTPYVTKVLRGQTNFTVESLVRFAAALDCRFTFHLQPQDSPPSPKTKPPAKRFRPRPALAVSEAPAPYNENHPPPPPSD
jgi:transcriptional regulator with XRE-family HTH domain